LLAWCNSLSAIYVTTKDIAQIHGDGLGVTVAGFGSAFGAAFGSYFVASCAAFVPGFGSAFGAVIGSRLRRRNTSAPMSSCASIRS